MKRTLYIIGLFFYLLVLTMVGRIEFLSYNRDISFFTLGDMKECLWHALPMDISTIAMMLMPVWLIAAMSFKWPRMRLRTAVAPYLATVVFCATAITCATIIMYENWKFLLDASVFAYASSPGNASASASAWYITSRLGLSIIIALLVSVGAVFITPKKIVRGYTRTKDIPANYGILYICCGLFLVWCAWGINGRRAAEEEAFYSDNLLISHATVNPVRHICSSVVLYSKRYPNQFHFTDEAECQRRLSELYPTDTEDVTDSLFTTDRPNVLTIQLESFGAPFIEALGGVRGVAPEISTWMKRGVWFSHAYAGSFRTDRGTVCALSGCPPYPTTSLMMDDNRLDALPSIARTLTEKGYSADYIYGSNAQHMNKEKYLLATGYQKVWDIDDLNIPDDKLTGWGASDSMALARMLELIQTKYKLGKPFYIGMQTIDSHEPFAVPYHRLKNKVYNAFGYTDHCLGQFLSRLSRTKAWSNLIVIVYADHGHTYNTTLANPEFFHMPLFMVGGAIRKAQKIDVLTAQSDIPATLLSQMGIPHSKDFPWSRNVLSRNYTHPFVYSNYPSGAMFIDDSGVTIYSISGERVITSRPDSGTEKRVQAIRTLLQGTYQSL